MSRDYNKFYAPAWAELQAQVKICEKCGLCRTRTNTVFGEGNFNTKLMIIGEGPGEDEDKTGQPFVGRAGQLLTKILNAAGINRNDIFITNIVKCRPPNNRVPSQDEMLKCGEFLEAQILLIRPKILVALGNTALKYFFKSNGGITKLRGQWLNWRGIPLFPMFHPSYLLRDDSRTPGSPKALTWDDVRELKKKLDELN